MPFAAPLCACVTVPALLLFLYLPAALLTPTMITPSIAIFDPFTRRLVKGASFLSIRVRS